MFKEARDQYTYRQDIKVQTRDGDTVTGEYHEVFDVLFDDKGIASRTSCSRRSRRWSREGFRSTKATYRISATACPLCSPATRFRNTTFFMWASRQEDKLHCYVFDIAPKEIVGKKRYFQGRIWVDDQDFQIVKTYGQAVPEIRDTKKKGKRKNISTPSSRPGASRSTASTGSPPIPAPTTRCNSTPNDIHIREIVKYEDYKRFGSNVRILYKGKEVPKADQKAAAGSESESGPEEAGRGAESTAAAEVGFKVSRCYCGGAPTCS